MSVYRQDTSLPHSITASQEKESGDILNPKGYRGRISRTYFFFSTIWRYAFKFLGKWSPKVLTRALYYSKQVNLLIGAALLIYMGWRTWGCRAGWSFIRYLYKKIKLFWSSIISYPDIDIYTGISSKTFTALISAELRGGSYFSESLKSEDYSILGDLFISHHPIM